MAIPTPAIPSAINPVGSVRLTPTENNRAFSINSGLIAADNTETTVISVADVGKRDILFCINPILTTNSSDNMTMKIKIMVQSFIRHYMMLKSLLIFLLLFILSYRLTLPLR